VIRREASTITALDWAVPSDPSCRASIAIADDQVRMAVVGPVIRSRFVARFAP
jgi:hypothetical protein